VLQDKSACTPSLASREVIVCAGALNSPQLLMLSGTGERGGIADPRISPVLHLPGVGRNLQDHFVARIQWVVDARELLQPGLARLAEIRGGRPLSCHAGRLPRLGCFHGRRVCQEFRGVCVLEPRDQLPTHDVHLPRLRRGGDRQDRRDQRVGLQHAPGVTRRGAPALQRSAGRAPVLAELPRRAERRSSHVVRHQENARHCLDRAARPPSDLRIDAGICLEHRRAIDRLLRARRSMCVSSGRELQDGIRCDGRGRFAPACAWDRQTARGGCVHHADGYRGQYQCAEHHDRRKGIGLDPRRSAPIVDASLWSSSHHVALPRRHLLRAARTFVVLHARHAQNSCGYPVEAVAIDNAKSMLLEL
jgi:hypothetical protein